MGMPEVPGPRRGPSQPPARTGAPSDGSVTGPNWETMEGPPEWYDSPEADPAPDWPWICSLTGCRVGRMTDVLRGVIPVHVRRPRPKPPARTQEALF